MSELDRERREMVAVLQRPGVRPDPSLRITRRTFIHKSCLTGAATVAQTFAWWPLLNTIDVAYAAEQPFKFAWVSDTHLYPRSLNTRFVEKVVRAANEVQAMNPPADFMIFGGDLAQLGKIEEVQFLDATGKKRRKSLVGWSERRKVFWHFAVEARPVLGAHPRFVLRQHIIFTADGSTPLVSKDRMHTLRRRFCKSWWNDRWRDMLIAFVTWLGPSAGLNLGGDTVLGLDDHLFALWSPLSLEDDANVSVESTDEIEDDELSTDDDIFDLADTSEFSPSEVSEVIGE
jgi:hypothetical protein